MGQRETKIDVGAADIQGQVFAQIERGRVKSRIIPAGVIVVFAILLEAKAREAKVAR